MNFDWNRLDQQSLTFVDTMRRQQEVLLAYDGPVLVTLTDDKGQYIGMAVDEDESGDLVRWIQAPISDLELDAVKLGAEPLRWALRKETVTVVDYDRQQRQPIRMWDVPIDRIPDDAFPEPGAFFPGSRKQRALSPHDHPMFSLAGKTAHNIVTFGELSAVATTLQSLWNAFAQSLRAQLAPLAVTAFASGSLKVMVHTDNPTLFDRIAGEYRKLVLASDEKGKLAAAIALLDPHVASTYRDYLKTLTLHQVEVLAEWRGEAAFVSYRTAIQARDNYPMVGVVRQISVTKENARMRGIFQGFLRGGGFQFYDLDGNKWYQGRISKSLRNTLPEEFDMALGRGFPKRYFAEIEIKRKGQQEPTYRLLSYTEAPDTDSTARAS